MAGRRPTSLNRTLAVVGGAFAVSSMLIALDRTSFGAATTGVPFVDRFGDVWPAPGTPGSPVLALQTPEPTGVPGIRALPNEIRIKGRLSESALDPLPGLMPSRRSATASKTVPVPAPAPANRQVAMVEPLQQTTVSDAGVPEPDSTFTLPDLGQVVVPVAAVGLAAFSVEEFLRDRASGGTAMAYAPPPPPAPVRPRLPGPFHVFVTTDPVGIGSGGASDAAAATGSGVVGGVVSGVGNTVNGVVGTAVGTAGGVVSTVGSVAGAVLRKR
jgi:hypothetical protein